MSQSKLRVTQAATGGENPKQSLGTYAWVHFVPNAAASSQFLDTALRSSSDTCCKGIFSDDGLGLFELYSNRAWAPIFVATHTHFRLI